MAETLRRLEPDSDVTLWDKDGRNAAYDIRIANAAGTVTAVEVTTVAGEGVHQLESLLSNDGFAWTPAGDEFWTVEVGHVRDLPRLRSRISHLVELCESLGISRPHQDYRAWDVDDEDLRWLIAESDSDIHSYADMNPYRPDGTRLPIYVLPSPQGGVVDERLEGLNAALEALLEMDYIVRRVKKVVSAEDVDERRLILVVHTTGLPDDVSLGLTSVSDYLPSEPLAMPSGLDELWLIPHFSRRILIADAEGWRDINRPEGDV